VSRKAEGEGEKKGGWGGGERERDTHTCIMHCECVCFRLSPVISHMGWLWLVGPIKLHVSIAKEPYKKDDILQKRPMILRSLLTVATPYVTDL